MGLQAVDPDLAAANAGGRFVTPAGMVLDGAQDTLEAPVTADASADPDGDGVSNEVPTALVDYLEFYLLNYFKPGLYQASAEQAGLGVLRKIRFKRGLYQASAEQAGLDIVRKIRCMSCHRRKLPLDHDRRVADVETVYDPKQGVFNQLFATATVLHDTIDDGSGFPTLKPPRRDPFVVNNIFTDFKRHDLGPAFYERNYDGSLRTDFMTTPLWGVGSTGPYGHDGRSINLTQVILRHGGEAQRARDAFAHLRQSEQAAVLVFLNSLVLFPPDDTASNLDPGDPTAVGTWST